MVVISWGLNSSRPSRCRRVQATNSAMTCSGRRIQRPPPRSVTRLHHTEATPRLTTVRCTVRIFVGAADATENTALETNPGNPAVAQADDQTVRERNIGFGIANLDAVGADVDAAPFDGAAGVVIRFR